MSSKKSIFKVDSYYFPYSYSFPDQDEDELILFVTRQTRLVLYLRLLLVLLGSVLVVFLSYQVFFLLAKIFPAFPVNEWGTIVTSLLALLLFVSFWWLRLYWKKTVLVVSNKRILWFVPKGGQKLECVFLSLKAVKKFRVAQSASFLTKLGFSSLVIQASNSESNFQVDGLYLSKQLKSYLAKLLSKTALEPFNPEGV